MSVTNMKSFIAPLCAVALLTFNSASGVERRFPDDFLFGTATAAYQIEGGWNADGKGESIWDNLVHKRPGMIKDGTNGDVAADSYHNYRRDVEMMRELGVDTYRFSLSWSRILPTGLAHQVNDPGITFYNNYINEMLKYNITPMVTLYHWDLPQKLQDLGGWANPLVADWFSDYAREAFKNFGDRVKLWITINEPREICHEGYGEATKAPAVDFKGVAEYICSKNLVMAHAKAWHVYNAEFRKSQGGKCGITISTNWFEAASTSEEDQAAAELLRQGEWGQYAHPIFSTDGGYPKELKERIATKSAAQGFTRSRLPDMSNDEIDYVKGTSDFYGMNHYTAFYVYSNASTQGIYPVPSYWDDMSSVQYSLNNWTSSESTWLKEVPWSMHRALTYVSSLYRQPDIYVTENGWSTLQGLDDESRVHYLTTSLNGVLDALADGVRVRGYMAWSLMDNFEWIEGLRERFGLYEVNYCDAHRTRTARKSAAVYRDIVCRRTLLQNSS